jgi:hypothetical protein
MIDELISRAALAKQLGVKPSTIAAWTARNVFPQPVQRVSGRVILYNLQEVEKALAARAARAVRRTGFRRR